MHYTHIAQLTIYTLHQGWQLATPIPPSTTYAKTQPNLNLAFSDSLPRQNQPTFSLNPISNPSPPPSTTFPHPQPTNTISNTPKTHNIPQPKITQTPPTPHITSSTFTCTATKHTIATKVLRLAELNHLKSQHIRQLTILSKHIANHPPPSPSGLAITMQPWVQLSQKHKEAWDNSLQNYMSTLITILCQHHTEQQFIHHRQASFKGCVKDDPGNCHHHQPTF